MKPAIEVNGLGKVYNISHEQKASSGNATFRDALNQIAHKPIELITGHRMRNEKFWAVKDVSFDVSSGEVVGIIGRNGSGKSTLLKILSRIVEPTEGEVTMRGKVASLLEVGTGFHPELTGRENVFFNGAILGMSQKEIKSKFNDIVEFSEVEQFLDTPVKFYSSGMYVRLAFAVAAHLDPDILIIDEVLAVGDAAFQKKCIAKMKDVAEAGRTVIFVSHSMDTVKRLCQKTILMQAGKMTFYGPTDEGIQQYLVQNANLAGKYKRALSQVRGKLSITNVSLKNPEGIVTNEFTSGEPVSISVGLKVSEAVANCQIAFELLNDDGICVLSSTNVDADKAHAGGLSLEPGTFATTCLLDTSFLRGGSYYIALSSSIPGQEILDELEVNLQFQIEEPNDITDIGFGRRGVIYKRLAWQTKKV